MYSYVCFIGACRHKPPRHHPGYLPSNILQRVLRSRSTQSVHNSHTPTCGQTRKDSVFSHHQPRSPEFTNHDVSVSHQNLHEALVGIATFCIQSPFGLFSNRLATRSNCSWFFSRTLFTLCIVFFEFEFDHS
jgi:hypothetical protein